MVRLPMVPEIFRPEIPPVAFIMRLETVFPTREPEPDKPAVAPRVSVFPFKLRLLPPVRANVPFTVSDEPRDIELPLPNDKVRLFIICPVVENESAVDKPPLVVMVRLDEVFPLNIPLPLTAPLIVRFALAKFKTPESSIKVPFTVRVPPMPAVPEVPTFTVRLLTAGAMPLKVIVPAIPPVAVMLIFEAVVEETVPLPDAARLPSMVKSFVASIKVPFVSVKVPPTVKSDVSVSVLLLFKLIVRFCSPEPVNSIPATVVLPV